MAPSGEVGPPWEVTCPPLGSGQGPCPSPGSDLSSRGKWSGTMSLCWEVTFPPLGSGLGSGQGPAIPWEVVRDRVPHREVGIHFPGVGITSHVWTFTSRVWAHFPYRVIPLISQGGSKCLPWCSHTLYPLWMMELLVI